MKAREFEQNIQNFFPELQVILHPNMQRWCVIEQKRQFILRPDGTPREFGVLYVVQDEHGSYRRPNFEDVQNVLELVDPSFSYKSGIDSEIDRLDLKTMERESAIAPGVEDMIDQTVHEGMEFDLKRPKTVRMSK